MARVFTEIEDMNATLAQAACVLCVKLAFDGRTSSYSVEVVLAPDPDMSASQVVLQADGVAKFEMDSFGGGLSQFTCLRIEDERARKLDRMRYRVRDLENDRIEFWCTDVRVAAD